MLRIGLTGGLASGKSLVGRTLAELGCLWIQADALGHAVLMPGGEAYEPVVEEFGDGILNADGTINREKLAGEVFGNPERLRKLSSFVHPPVIARENEIIEEYEAREPGGIAVVEAAILIETGNHKRFDRLIVTHCELEQQVERAVRRGGATREAVIERLNRQLPAEEKLCAADYVVDTSGTKENTMRQVREIYQALRSIKS